MDNLKRVGLYGVSSAGKTTIAKYIDNWFNDFKYVDSSEVINSVCLGGISQFKKLSDLDKNKYRKKAIDYLWEYQIRIKKHLIITGHFSFLQKDGSFKDVWNKYDNEFYTDIIHIKDTPDNVYKRCKIRKKTCISIEAIAKWIEHEELSLKSITSQDIYYIKCTDLESKLSKVQELINKFILEVEVENIVSQSTNKLVVLMDADGTLIPYDSATIMSKYLKDINLDDIKKEFKKYSEYCFKAFDDVAKYYSKKNSYLDFIIASEKSVSEIKIREDFIDLIKSVNADFIIVTAGFYDLWKNVTQKQGLYNVKVIGGNTIHDKYIIGQKEKGYVVDVLRKHNKKVVCFGDSLVDKIMFLKSDLGYLILDSREKSIVPFLKKNKKIQYVSYKELKLENIRKTNFNEIKNTLENLSYD